MVVLVVILLMAAVCVGLAVRFRGSDRAPRTCCSTRPWPPDDLRD